MPVERLRRELRIGLHPVYAPRQRDRGVRDGVACAFNCNAGYHRCGDVCVANASILGCGAACTPCAMPPGATTTCDGRACGYTCLAGLGDCDRDAANGCEVDLRVTVSSCGACGRACVAPANATSTCAASVYGFACNAGFGDCDRNAGNGCEADVSANPASCGMCGARAPPASVRGRRVPAAAAQLVAGLR
ncbi:MAG: hypothetical protein U0325_35845 [Polyangiales bacterium]